MSNCYAQFRIHSERASLKQPAHKSLHNSIMVSLIITAFNYDQFLERAIRSAIEQSLARQEYEVIVVNDASTDRTSEILDNFKEDVRVYNLEKNLGLAGARNYGLRKSKGQFVMFIDADDFVHKDIIAVTKLFLAENVNLDAIAVDYWVVNERGLRLEHVSAVKSPIACGILFRKDFLFDVGLYDEEFRAREEEDLRIRWLEKFTITNLPIPLYRYRMHESNLTKDAQAMDKGLDRLHKKHGNKG